MINTKNTIVRPGNTHLKPIVGSLLAKTRKPNCHMHHSWWSYNKTPTHRRRENPKFSREIELIKTDIWVLTTTLLCSIFLPVLVKAIPCIGKDLGMSTVAYASLMVELQQDAYTSKTTEVSPIFEGNQADRFRHLGDNHYLVVLYFPASACQSHPMYR